MEFRILGATDVVLDGEHVEVGHARQRSVLAALLVDANRPVSVAQLVDRVWGEFAPHRPVDALYSYVSRLKRALAGIGEMSIVKDRGYSLRVDPLRVDLHRFDDLVTHAARSDDHRALELLDEALSLWRGPMPSEPDTEWFTEMRGRAQRRYHAAMLDRNDLALRIPGQSVSLAALAAQIDEHSLDERLAGQWMLALDRSGSRARALEHYAQLRRRLVDELGTDPSPALQLLHQRILTSDADAPALATIRSQPALATAPRMLPAQPRSFTGREEYVQQLVHGPLGGLDEDDYGQAMTGVCTIDGMPGVGKTALAVHIAHQIAHRFRDGQFFLNLQAHTPGQEPLDTADALSALLTAAGLEPEAIPADLASRSAVWRQLMADKAILVVLDNAADHRHVQPLLPASVASLVLITSRRRLEAIEDAESLSLDVLSPADAHDLFKRVSRTREDDSELILVLVEICGYLPLAITLLAGRLRHHSTWTLRYLTDKVANTRDRLTELRAENLDVATAFDLSYQSLSPSLQRLFRRFGTHPGADIDIYAAAALNDTDVSTTASQLDTLYTDHLIEEPAPGRYRCHDLVRHFAQTLATQYDSGTDRDHAVDRVVAYYLHACARANRHFPTSLTPLPPITDSTSFSVPEISTPQGAHHWLEADYNNIASCISNASRRSNLINLVAVSGFLFPFLRTRGLWRLALTLHEAALSMTHTSGDAASEALVLNRLGHTQVLIDDYPGAIDSFSRAQRLFAHLDDTAGQALTLHQLGRMRYLAGSVESATEILTKSYDLYAKLENRRGMAHAQVDIGQVHYLTGHYTLAVEQLTEAHQIAISINDRLCEALALNNIGHAHYLTGERQLAKIELNRAYSIFTDLRDKIGQAQTLIDIGQLQCADGEYSMSLETLLAAKDMFIDLNNDLGLAHSLYQLGELHRKSGKLDPAREVLRRAYDLYLQLGNSIGIAESLNSLGELAITSSPSRETLKLHREALSHARHSGLRAEEARALQGIGRHIAILEGTSRALDHLSQAKVSHRKIKDEITEAKRTRQLHGRAALRTSIM
ncbi:BTAD domain-containing putative transcriptional regulator [Amycolatopsis sp. PS_44_ISF1]|uniref:AfsR/SARP family transcriptional regulator n=1 Tax=Amycolatopsis sp. PS_44_ISF1 TaxID=2974917 RepID=UPI0028DFB172|nr:BTAD domain-containing putative transcriptional regulator [Amycolatopsis sp. PS_44_ISF1]MDT8916075.1 tetratricopeptide repeat protein [Amycolatopsis sp. PS_44_ISF1]